MGQQSDLWKLIPTKVRIEGRKFQEAQAAIQAADGGGESEKSAKRTAPAKLT